MIDGRGKHMEEVFKKNNDRIKEWLKNNKNSTQTQCCKDLGLSPVTVRKHLNLIKKESS